MDDEDKKYEIKVIANIDKIMLLLAVLGPNNPLCALDLHNLPEEDGDTN